jgi:hypothetical protein
MLEGKGEKEIPSAMSGPEITGQQADSGGGF